MASSRSATGDGPAAPLADESAGEQVKQVVRGIEELIPRNAMRFEWLSPRQIADHDLNWKTHPSLQREAYREFLGEVGWVGALLYNERTGRLIDGHMRLQDALENNLDEVPVLVIDIDQEVEIKALALLDQIGVMFDTRRPAVQKLAEIASTRSDLLRQILDHGVDGSKEGGEDDDSPDASVSTPVALPPGGISLVLGEGYDYIVLMFKREIDYVSAQDHFGIEEVKCAFNSGVGLGRVIDGGEYLARIQRELRVGRLGMEEK